MTYHHLIEPEQLDSVQDNVLLVDLCSDEQYLRGHIPGAVHVSPAELISGRPPAPGKLPDKARLDALFSRLGLTPDTTVIVYDDEGGGWAGRMAWTLDMVAHTHWRYLNGGLRAWHGAGLPLETTVNEPVSRPVNVSLSEEPVMDAEAIMTRLGDEDFAVWDARSREEYDGTRAVARRGGHIPGAVHCEWTSLMDPARGLRIREDSQQILDRLGLGADKTVVTHCQSHHRSGFTYLVARILGYPHIRAYDGSWSEWGNRDDTPVETGT